MFPLQNAQSDDDHSSLISKTTENGLDAGARDDKLAEPPLGIGARDEFPIVAPTELSATQCMVTMHG